MGKADRIRQRNVREKIAAQQAAARRAEARRRTLLASGSVLAVLVVVVALIIAKGLSKPAKAADVAAKSAAAVAQQITTVPTSTLSSVGKGNASALLPTQGKQALLTADGKPEMLYMGAEYCPYCAAERWAMVVALSKFGTFSGLSFIHSSSTDVYPNTPTLTFEKATYTSKYLDFVPVEMYGLVDNGILLDHPTTQESALMNKFDAPPYVATSDKGAFPFVDFGNQYLIIGAQYIPGDLADLSWSQVAADVRNPSSTVAKDIDGSANSIIGAICKITNDKPAVCSSSAAQAGEGLL